MGLLDEEPHVRMSGAQADGCSPVADAFDAGRDVIRPVRPDTIAKSLAIGDPADGVYALDEVRTSGGAFGAVTDDEIIAGIQLLARTEGIFAETAGGVTIATLAQLAESGVVRSDERVVVYVTGNGLKTLEAVAPRLGPTATIAPTVSAFEAAVDFPEVPDHGCDRPHPTQLRPCRGQQRGPRRGDHGVRRAQDPAGDLSGLRRSPLR